jgi:hypothetical protein
MRFSTHVLSGQAIGVAFQEFGGRLSDLRKLAQVWLIPGAKQLDQQKLVAQLKAAFQDPTTAQTIVSQLSPVDRAVLQAYRRYGTGSVSGAVIRMDLMSRGLLRANEQKSPNGYLYRHWERDPTNRLHERAFLISPQGSNRQGGSGYSRYGGWSEETERPLPTYALHPALAKYLVPADPPSWSVPAVQKAVSLGKPRSSAEVGFELARVFSAVAGRKFWSFNRSGQLSTPARKALIKAVPLGEDIQFPLPERQAFYFELMRRLGVIKIDVENAHGDEAAAQFLFSRSTPEQARLWVSAWLKSECWTDGFGSTDPQYVDSYNNSESSLSSQRQVLTWALSCLAGQHDQWFDLKAFVEHIVADGGSAVENQNLGLEHRPGWDPAFIDRYAYRELQGNERKAASWLAREGFWTANAVMVTLAALGFIERGRAEGAELRYCFRLTPLGRTLFGAPEIPVESQPTGKFLVVQPNFDAVAYLDQTDAQGIGSLGLLLENVKPTLGAVQTFRLTHQAFYRALELGLTYERSLELLQRASQHELPANVLETLKEWSARRESMVVKANVTLLGFANRLERDSHLTNGMGRACGDRWVIVEGGQILPAHSFDGALTVDHSAGRLTLVVNEQGLILHQEPLDTVQISRLRLIAELDGKDWSITSAGVGRAISRGMQPTLVRKWLTRMLEQEMPPLMWHALEAWMGKRVSMNLGAAQVLRVPEEELFVIISESDFLRPLILGTFGPGWIVVKPEGVKELARLLSRYGFEVTPGITPEMLEPRIT